MGYDLLATLAGGPKATYTIRKSLASTYISGLQAIGSCNPAPSHTLIRAAPSGFKASTTEIGHKLGKKHGMRPIYSNRTATIS